MRHHCLADWDKHWNCLELNNHVRPMLTIENSLYDLLTNSYPIPFTYYPTSTCQRHTSLCIPLSLTSSLRLMPYPFASASDNTILQL